MAAPPFRPGRGPGKRRRIGFVSGQSAPSPLGPATGLASSLGSACGPTFIHCFQYQALAQPPLGSIGTRDWFVPFAEPVRPTRRTPDCIAFVAVVATAEAITADKWFNPLSDPVRPKPRTPDHFALLTLPAGIDWFQPLREPVRPKPRTPDHFALPTPPAAIDWFQPLIEPVRRKPQTPDCFAYSESAQFPETVTESRWHQPWSDPVRPKPRTPDHFAQLTPPAVIDWHQRLTEPTRRKPQTPDWFAIGRAAPFPESITEDRWHQAWSEPVRRKPPTPDCIAFVSVVVSTEVVTPDKWFSSLSDPTRAKPRTPDIFVLGRAAPFPESVTEDRWHQPWSDPPKPKPRAAVYEPSARAEPPPKIDWFAPLSEPIVKVRRPVTSHPALAHSPRVEIVTVDKWVYGWSEPVRYRRFHTALQQALVTPGRLGTFLVSTIRLATADTRDTAAFGAFGILGITVRLNVQDRADVDFFDLRATNPPARARVSIREIKGLGTGINSIAERRPSEGN